ncbi:1-phosphofructokinase family hexose kinase [Microbacterium sp. Se5.02b]|uniref:1-phosphofructokinase family hexose kinase n=1 Tax=Microbacterium sp. Se5.02b TaxID=2864103 RepID=UPI001C68A2A5|nr:PfkB family carbohydrate kinase [Microbacterium sp. Se5.02b]QYM65038.1 hypothetical protein K1X59_04105 [Microbacterium sp. Se5.02b]
MNVSAALDLAGVRTAAVVVVGEDDLAFAQRSAHRDLLRIVAVPGATRVNTSVIDDAGATTKINAPTPPISGTAWLAAQAAVTEACTELGAGWVVISGTVPAVDDAPASLVDVVQAAARGGRRVAVDTSGAALSALAVDPAGIALMKPNTHELAELIGTALRTIGDVVSAARQLRARGVGIVYTSMGADGVLVVSESGVVHAKAEARGLVNTAGAGDASLAGFLVGLGGEGGGEAALARAAATAASWGAHAVAQSTTILRTLDDLPAAEVTRDPDAAVELTEPAV